MCSTCRVGSLCLSLQSGLALLTLSSGTCYHQSRLYFQPESGTHSDSEISMPTDLATQQNWQNRGVVQCGSWLFCGSVCDCWLVVLSDNTHTWCVSRSSRKDRWEERSHAGLSATTHLGTHKEIFVSLCLFLSLLFFSRALPSVCLNPLRNASHSEYNKR